MTLGGVNYLALAKSRYVCPPHFLSEVPPLKSKNGDPYGA